MKYLFKEWNKIEQRLVTNQAFLFLDYDGTITPIAGTPQRALLPKTAKRLLRQLSKSAACEIAIMSGRALKDIKEKVGLKGIIYSGNHGLEAEGSKIKFKAPVSKRYKEILKSIKTNLKRRLSRIRGTFVEDKNLSLSLHYRLADKNDIPKIEAIFHETVILYLVKNEIKVNGGKMVLEIRPPIKWDKGRMALWLLANQKPALKNKNIFPVYIGDDLTDEYAFKALARRGLTVRVGRKSGSLANYYLKDTDEVLEFLRRVCLNR